MSRLFYILLTSALILSNAQAESISDYVFPSITASKTEVYVGEPFEVYLTIRSHSLTLDQEFSMNPFRDAAIKQLPRDTAHYPVERRVVDNRIEEIRKFSWSAVGVSTGQVDLSNTLDLSVLSRSTSLFLSRPKRTPFSIPVKGTVLTVKPVPEEGRPDGYSGAIGRFSLTADISPNEAAPGDVVRIRTEVRGEGLLDNATPPMLDSVEGLKVYDPRRIADESAMVFEQQVVPQTRASLKIPELSFTYFDPSRAVYETLRAGPFHVKFREAAVTDEAKFRPDEEQAGNPAVRPGGLIRVEIILPACAGLALLLAILTYRVGARKRAAALGGTAAILALAAASYMRLQASGYFEKSMFRTRTQQAGRLAPSGSSVQTVLLPSGAYVEYLECRDGWALVSYGGRHCWIQESNLDSAGKTPEK